MIYKKKSPDWGGQPGEGGFTMEGELGRLSHRMGERSIVLRYYGGDGAVWCKIEGK